MSIEAPLPTWAQMSDLDKGAALLHMWKRSWEGASYAIEEYPCQYIESPLLLTLSPRQMCAHALAVCESHERMVELLGETEHDRLYKLARVEGEEILASRKPWGVRFENGRVAECATREEAEFHVYDLSWRGVELLRRFEPGGDWTVLVDARNLEQDARLSNVRVGDQVLREGLWTEVTDTGSYRRTLGQVDAGLPTRWVELADHTRIELPHDDDPQRYWARIRRGNPTPPKTL